jgi:hypothetical protein
MIEAPAPADVVQPPAKPRFVLGAPPRWLTRGALAAALLAALVVGGRFLWNAMPAWPARSAEVAPATVTAKPVAIATGSLRVTSTPSGARVLVDGKPRGVTPLNLTDVSPGVTTSCCRATPAR